MHFSGTTKVRERGSLLTSRLSTRARRRRWI
ncbi:hypothetical protein OESDEN_01881 [Oesophagostomum dentatum]|uniref:Uncharacterized protein n=1 Tax=Oesophagostomum dentatum TaxID=61180 RepID=A0A0B1TKV0_OESDE|nr:hypothetical protein OESDEN_01881 [Oesophagostomum dentatum]